MMYSGPEGACIKVGRLSSVAMADLDVGHILDQTAHASKDGWYPPLQWQPLMYDVFWTQRVHASRDWKSRNIRFFVEADFIWCSVGECAGGVVVFGVNNVVSGFSQQV